MGAPLKSAHGALLTIDLAALAGNWTALAEKVRPAACAGVVKADAYGIGLEEAVAALWQAGCRIYCVAHFSEGLRARSVQKDAIIYVLNGLPENMEPDYDRANLIPVLGSLPEFTRWNEYCAHHNEPLPAALHFDTGMNRHGFNASDITGIKAKPLHFPIALVMSHFSASEHPDDAANARQIAALAKIRAEFPDIPASLANSSGIFLAEQPFYDLARPGYALYGGNPTPQAPNPMKRVISLEAPILQIRDVEPGAPVGYNSIWTAPRPSRLATLSLGYADGLPRSSGSSNIKPGALAYIGAKACPFVGGISMDLSVIDITDTPQAQLGTMVEILGDHQSVDQLGAAAGTVGYEILTRLGRRYQRTHIGG